MNGRNWAVVASVAAVAIAATGQIKYRVPCILPSETSYEIPQAELDHLGLSPDEGQLLGEAQRRSNARIWAAVRPLCAEILRNDDAVDLLGAHACMSLIERAAARANPLGSHEARRAVGEVHAGLRDAPPPGEQSPLYRAFMAFTSEGSLFEADLAETFGPEEARRLAQNMRCAATRK